MRMGLKAISFGAAGALIEALIGALLGPYDQYLVARIATLMVVTVGLTLLIGTAGLLSLASSAFMGVGAFTVVILMTTLNLPVWLSIPLGIAFTWAVGWLLGFVSLRISGLYLALVTLGFLLAFEVLLRRGGNLTGSGYGLVVPNATLGEFTISAAVWAVTAVFVAAVIVVLTYSLLGSRVGRAWKAVKHSETAAELFGVNLTQSKTSAFAISAALAAVAGALYAFLQGAISPQAFDLSVTVEHLTYAVVGGLGSVAGAVIGPLVLELIPELLRGFQEQRELLFGIILLAILVAAPNGIAGVLRAAFAGRKLPAHRRPTAELSGRPAVSTRSSAVDLTDAAPRPTAREIDVQAQVPSEPRTSIAVNHLSVVYGGLFALHDVSFDVGAGQLHGLIGANGAGKTTLLNALTGLVSLHEGEVVFEGNQLASPERHIRRSGLIGLGVARTFQTPVVVPDLSALDNVLLGLHAAGRGGIVRHALRTRGAAREEADGRRRSLEALGVVGFTGNPVERASRLGFGQLRQIELARALVAQPKLLLLDEPTSGLEWSAAERTMEVLRRLRDDSWIRLTTLIVEHNVPLIFEACDQVTVLDRGALLVSGEPAGVRADPAVRDAYLGRQAVA